MGKDEKFGRDYGHRRDWILERLELLASCFAIDVAFFATLSNHMHLVLRSMPRLVKQMGNQEVARRWLRVYPGKRVLDGQWIEPTQAQVEALAQDKVKLKKIRKRLSSISWFMGALSEYVARRANLEDDVTGCFWESRFKCREVADESALLVCGIYVDLNQMRAGEACTPEDSFYSSISHRLLAESSEAGDTSRGRVADWLAPLTVADDQLGEVPSSSGRRASDKGLLSIPLADYTRLLLWTAGQVERDEPEPMPEELAGCAAALGVVPEEFATAVRDFPASFSRVVGRREHMVERANGAGRRWFRGIRRAAEIFINQT